MSTLSATRRFLRGCRRYSAVTRLWRPYYSPCAMLSIRRLLYQTPRGDAVLQPAVLPVLLERGAEDERRRRRRQFAARTQSSNRRFSIRRKQIRCPAAAFSPPAHIRTAESRPACESRQPGAPRRSDIRVYRASILSRYRRHKQRARLSPAHTVTHDT